MSQYRYPDLGAAAFGQFTADIVTNASVVLAVRGDGARRGLSILGSYRLGHDDQGKIPSLLAQRVDLLPKHFEAVGDLGDEDDISTTGDAGGQCDMSGIPPHDLQHHHTIVARGSGLQVI